MNRVARGWLCTTWADQVQDALAENEAKAQSAAATEQLRQQVQELEQRVQAAQAADAVADKEMSARRGIPTQGKTSRALSQSTPVLDVPV